MQVVSKAYRDAMNKPFRNRSYIRASIGVINSEAQASASADYPQNSFTYFSDIKKPFENISVSKVYATSEQDFSKVDGSMYFLPKEGEMFNNGMVTEELFGVIYIGFGGAYGLDIKGLTIDFGDCFPVDFTIENEAVKRVYKGNTNRNFVTDEVFDGTSYLLITPNKMVNGQGRLRIYQISFGVVNVFTNKETTNFTLKDYVSPITETIPSMDMSLTIDNQDQYYSPDNPESTLAYFEVGQEMKVAFGYDVLGDGNIEWTPEVTAYLNTWSATDTEAKFTATDRFDNMSGTYYKGLYRENGISLYDLTIDVLHDAGILDEREYYIDPYLKDVVVHNPLPAVSHSEALQIIANAGRCVLFEDRLSRIHIQASFVPAISAAANNQTWFSDVSNILNDGEKDAYAMASNDFSIADGSVFFMPVDNQILNIGYVSESIWTVSDEGIGAWDGEPPKITLSLEAGFVPYGLLINFRNTAPKKFSVVTYYQDIVVENFTVENPELEYMTNRRFELFDRLEITFSEGYPNARVTVDNILIGDVSSYILSRNTNMTGSPTATRQNKVKSINVKRLLFQKDASGAKEILSEELVLPVGAMEHIVYFANPATDLSVSVENAGSITASIISSSNYFAKILFSGSTSDNTVVKFTVSGNEYVQREQWYEKSYNKNGDVREWSNPLISSLKMAMDLEVWLATHFLGDVEYNIPWRGDPSTDANDLFYLELKNRETTLIRCYQNELKFSGSLSGTIKSRRAVVSWR